MFNSVYEPVVTHDVCDKCITLLFLTIESWKRLEFITSNISKSIWEYCYAVRKNVVLVFLNFKILPNGNSHIVRGDTVLTIVLK